MTAGWPGVKERKHKMTDTQNHDNRLMAAFEAARTKQTASTEPVSYTRDEVLTSAVACVREGIEHVLPESGITQKMAEKFVQRLGRAMRDAVPAPSERAPAVSLDSEPMNVEALSSVPAKKGSLNTLTDDELKELVADIYGSKPRGRFDGQRQKWIDKLFRERKAA